MEVLERKAVLFFIYWILFLVSSCHKPQNKFIGKKLNLIDNRDLAAEIIIDDKKSFPKIVYSMNADCGYCIAKLKKWNRFLSLKPSLLSHIIVYANSKSGEYDLMEYVIENEMSVEFPVYKDSLNKFRTFNMLSAKDPDIFVINRDSSIILIGSPFEDKSLMKKFKDVFYEDKNLK